MKTNTLILSAVLLLGVQTFAAETVNFAWDASPDSGCTYTLKRGGVQGVYTNSISVGTNLTASVPNLPVGLYYWIVTANKAGIESIPSNEVSYTVRPGAPGTFRVTSTLQSSATVNGPWKDVAVYNEFRPNNTSNEILRVVMDIERPASSLASKPMLPPMPPPLPR